MFTQREKAIPDRLAESGMQAERERKTDRRPIQRQTYRQSQIDNETERARE